MHSNSNNGGTCYGIKTIHINKHLGENFNFVKPFNFYENVNFYKKCPNKNDTLTYNGIKIVSDGKKTFAKSEDQKEYFTYNPALNFKKRIKKFKNPTRIKYSLCWTQ